MSHRRLISVRFTLVLKRDAHSNARGIGDWYAPAWGDAIGPAETGDGAVRKQGSISCTAATRIRLGSSPTVALHPR